MTDSIQVEPAHYDFATYVTKRRWISFWHQLDEVLALKPDSVLEVGVGTSVFSATLRGFNVSLKTMDIDARLKPDIVGSILDIPSAEQTFDVACAFQVLEHLPYDRFIPAMRELMRVSKKAVLISLPDAKPAYPVSVAVPKLGICKFVVPSPRLLPREHQFNGEHYWEQNKKGFGIAKVVADLEAEGWAVTKNYRVPENLYHRFLRVERRAK